MSLMKSIQPSACSEIRILFHFESLFLGSGDDGHALSTLEIEKTQILKKNKDRIYPHVLRRQARLL